MTEAEMLYFLRGCFKRKESELQIKEQLQGMDEADLFYGLFPIAAAYPYQRRPVPVWLAANLLLELNPPCLISCEEAIRAMKDWEVSLEELPFYLCKQFGVETVLETCEKILKEDYPRTDGTRPHADAVKYWTRIARDDWNVVMRLKGWPEL